MEAHVLAQGPDFLVRRMELQGRETSPWHYHTRLTETVSALSPGVVLELRDPVERVELIPGTVHSILPYRPHRLVNHSAEGARTLLIQGGGAYDFVEVSGQTNPE